MPLPGKLCIQGWHIRLRLIHAAGLAASYLQNDPFCAHLSRTAIGQELWVRTRRAGDRFQPLGMEGTRKLKEFMIDAHIPQVWRDGVPLLVGKDGIAWVMGWRIAHWARVTPETRDVVEVTFSRQA